MKKLELKEQRRHGAPDFPMQYYHIDAEHPRYEMNLHWHGEFELVRVLQGELRLYLNNVEYVMTVGEIAFIGSGVLHRAEPFDCVYECVVFDLNILAKSIETNKRNFTRFLIVADPLLASELKADEREINKSSIVFTLPHTHGALSKVLTIFSFYDINLSKIQSLPIIGREWEYRFYVDLTFDSFVRYMQSIDAVRPLMNDFRILGEYKECTYEI